MREDSSNSQVSSHISRQMFRRETEEVSLVPLRRAVRAVTAAHVVRQETRCDDTSPRYGGPDAPRSRQPLTTCVATTLGGLAPLSRGGTRGDDDGIGYVRPDSTPFVLSGRLEALGRRNRDSAAAPDSLRSAPETAPLRAAPAVCPILRLLERTLAPSLYPGTHLLAPTTVGVP